MMMWSPALLRVIMSLSVLMTPTIRSLTTNCCEIINFHPEPNQITLLVLPQEYYFVLLAALVACAAHLPLNSLSCSTYFSSNTNKNTNKKKINNNPINIYIPRFLQEPTNNTIAVQLYTPPLAWMLIKFNICSKISCHVFSEFYNTSTLHIVS